jgi:formylglycine-generating enzyme required for sulfatase activity
MRFVPVPGTKVLMCVHETRHKDYAMHASETQETATTWKNQTADDFIPTNRPEDHPVINVSWEDAQKFCDWLAKKEGKTYRLPTDEEWSLAVGIGLDESWKKDTTPATVFKNSTVFPWGNIWPPPKDSVNVSDESRMVKAPKPNGQYLEGYDDGNPTTAPVMSFNPNQLGLYDLGGNVWEWCADWYDLTNTERVVRGGSWRSSDKIDLVSSRRRHYTPGLRVNDYGFRIVLELPAP